MVKSWVFPVFRPFLHSEMKAKKIAETLDSQGFPPSAADRIRTGDLLTTNEVRYRLCHNSIALNELFYYTGSVSVLQV